MPSSQPEVGASPRKQARPSRAAGKAGQRAVEAILEGAGLVVQPVQQENDIGRDAFVEIVEDGSVTGGVISLQIKSGSSYFHCGSWVVPGHPEDFTLWRESTVPFFGVVHDPASGAMRWVDLTSAARILDPYLSPIVDGPFGRKAVAVPEDNRLDLVVRPFKDAAADSLRRYRGLPAHALLSGDPETTMIGIMDTFAIGRFDPNAFVLLGALFHRLPTEARRLALSALAMCTDHPDVFWTKSNWIPEAVKSTVRLRTAWTATDVEALLAMVDEDGIGRGTVGQHVFHILKLDSQLADRLFETAVSSCRSEAVRSWAAIILAYLSDDKALEITARLIRLAPDLAEYDLIKVLVEHLREWGSIDLF